MSRESEERMFRIVMWVTGMCSAFAAFYVRSLAEEQKELNTTVNALCITVAKLDERIKNLSGVQHEMYYGASLQTVLASNDALKETKKSKGCDNEDANNQ